MTPFLEEVNKEILSGAAQLFDVREESEWDDGHLVSASLVPLSILRTFDLPEGVQFDKSKKTYIHCKSGRRVQEAAPILEDLGFEDVIALDEGFSELAEEGFEVAK